MEFRLHYRGQLKSNARPDVKHELRRHFHRQLRDLWTQQPLADQRYLLGEDDRIKDIDLRQRVGDFTFVPLVSARLHLLAELDILLLRPEAPGSIVTQAGDIDNRLKTLLDALKVPKDRSDRPKSIVPASDEDPFFCLLDDDNLITRLSVTSDRLLEPAPSASDVLLVVRVRTRVARHIIANESFI